MQRETNLLTEPIIRPEAKQEAKIIPLSILTMLAVGVVLFLALYNLTNFPTPWFDEGSHLHVPKTLVRFGVYADYSSEGFRHYGPTIGVGPTVMLPIAAAFRLFGIGLLQARLVMVLYLLATIWLCFRLADHLGGRRLAWIATALLIVTPGVALLEFGRQVLGEVPGLFFVVIGFYVWFTGWPQAGWRRLFLAGLLLGLAMVTKHQYLLLLAPTLGLAWLANLVYYRLAPQRVFIVPGIVAVTCFTLWQVYLILYLGPATAKENLAMFREFTSGAALVFSPDLMRRAISELLSLKVYLGLIGPVVAYGFIFILPRRQDRQQWGILWFFIIVNLVWYVVASIGWLRYAFPGLALTSLFVARFFLDLINSLSAERGNLGPAFQQATFDWSKFALRGVMVVWLSAMIVLPLGQTIKNVVSPPFNAPAVMGAYLNENVSQEALIETWEPEMGFLTDHNYHFPPPLLLNNAVGYIWLGGAPPAEKYDFVQVEQPDYVLVGEFARWVELYPADFLAEHYHLVTTIGAYDLYALN